MTRSDYKQSIFIARGTPVSGSLPTGALQIRLDMPIRAGTCAGNETIELEDMNESRLGATSNEHLKPTDHARRDVKERGERRNPHR